MDTTGIARITVGEFCTRNGISMTAERVERNPNFVDSEDMDHWKVVFTRRGCSQVFRMTTYFSMGRGHHGAEPEAGGVLECLASDSASVTESFEEWARDMGYSTDSRKAE